MAEAICNDLLTLPRRSPQSSAFLFHVDNDSTKYPTRQEPCAFMEHRYNGCGGKLDTHGTGIQEKGLMAEAVAAMIEWMRPALAIKTSSSELHSRQPLL
jgi:hypothetical protein